jgi:hypothetical protein
MSEKPPIGIMPKSIHDDIRFISLCDTIQRYFYSETQMPVEWIEEWNEHVNRRQIKSGKKDKKYEIDIEGLT